MVHFPYKNNPTTDIYFAIPLHDLIKSPLAVKSNCPISRIGPNCFLANNRAVVIRYITEKELQTLHRLKVDKLFYIIDDDFQFLQDDNSLPEDYRRRLLNFSSNQLPKLLAITDAVVAPNDKILKSYSDKQTFFLHPSFTALCDDFSHFKETGTIKILFSGTRSHLNDLRMVEQTLSRICQKNPDVQLTTFLADHAPETLLNQPNIIHRKAKFWKSYRKILRTERFHIALTPHADTIFNQSRSINKLYDHAAFGAAGIYTDMPPLNQIIENGQSGLLIGHGATNWEQAINNLIQNISFAKQIAQNGASLAKKLGNHEVVRSFWMEKLFGKAID